MTEFNPLMMQMVNNVICQCEETPDRWADGRTTYREWAEQLLAWDIPGYVKCYDV